MSIDNTSENQSQTVDQPTAVKPIKTMVMYRAKLTALTNTTENVETVDKHNASAKRGKHDYAPTHAILDFKTSNRAEFFLQGETVLYDDRETVFWNFISEIDGKACKLTELLPDTYFYLTIYKTENYGKDEWLQCITYHAGGRYTDIEFKH